MTTRAGRFLCAFAGVLLGAAGGISPAHGFELNGFGDASYTVTDVGPDGGASNGFSLGQLDLYLAEELGDRLDILTELVWEFHDGETVTEIERLQVGYAIDNGHYIRAGRFHNLMGFWNLAYHHGRLLHMAINRPFFLEFEDEHGLLPTHTVGLWWSKRFDLGSREIQTGIMFGNGTSITGDLSGAPSRLNPGSQYDNDNGKSATVRVAYSSGETKGLTAGASAQVGTVEIRDMGALVADDDIDQLIWALDLTYSSEKLELLAEYYAWRHDSETLATDFTGTSAFYVQGSFTLGKLSPYARVEQLDGEADDPYFIALGYLDPIPGAAREKRIATLGIRLNMNYRSALKVEYRAVDDDREGSYHEGAAQWAFAF